MKAFLKHYSSFGTLVVKHTHIILTLSGASFMHYRHLVTKIHLLLLHVINSGGLVKYQNLVDTRFNRVSISAKFNDTHQSVLYVINSGG